MTDTMKFSELRDYGTLTVDEIAEFLKWRHAEKFDVKPADDPYCFTATSTYQTMTVYLGQNIITINGDWIDPVDTLYLINHFKAVPRDHYTAH